MGQLRNCLFATMMAAIVFLTFSPEVNGQENIKRIAVKVSAYTLNKGKTASGKCVKHGYIAVSRDLEKKHRLKFGDKVFISGMGEFEIQDRTSLSKKNLVDVYMPCHKKAKRFGIRRTMLVLNSPKMEQREVSGSEG